MGIFRTYDLRGIYGQDLTDDIAIDVGKAIGTFLKGKAKVCVGYDTRPSSKNLYYSLISGLTSTGCDVITLGMGPNPLAYFFAWKNKTYGCYVTASHNPVEWNGFKIFKPNGVSLTEEIKEIEKIFNSKEFISGKGEIKDGKVVMKSYIKFLKDKIGKVKGKVVVDFLGGSGVGAIEVLKEMGLDIISLHDKPNASLYGFHRLEPWGELLNEVKETVKNSKAAFGVAMDCDADRSVFVDSSGNYVDSSIINGIFIENLLKKRKKGKIIATYDCAIELEDFIRKLGGKLEWNRIGHGFIEQRVFKEKALFAGEQTYHFYFNIFYPFSDGILSTLYLAKILNERKKSLDSMKEKIKFNPIDRLYIDAKDDDKKVKVVEKIRKDYARSLDIVDGFKIKLSDDEWVIIRASQNLPEVNLSIQAKDNKRLKELVKKYSKIIEQKIGEVDG